MSFLKIQRLKTHKLKGRSGDGQAVAVCGAHVHSHLIVSFNEHVQCKNCRKKLGLTDDFRIW